MKIERYVLKILAVFGIALFVLSACNQDAKEPPEEVIKKFKETVKTTEAADMSAELSMVGKDEDDTMDFNVEADIKLDRREDVEHKGNFDVKLDGSLTAGGKVLDGNLHLILRMIGEDFYFNLLELESSDENVQEFKPVLEPYQEKWLRMASDFIPENLKELQKKDEEALEKEGQLKDLFINTKLIEVIKEYGVESLGGKKVYHYGVKLDKEGLKTYMRKAASINDQEMTEAEIEEAAVFADSVTNMEMWIGEKDYYLYKGIAEIEGSDNEKGVDANISLSYIANSYNADPKIETPAEYEDFNPITLFMGMQMQGMMGGGLEGGDIDLSELEGLDLPE